MTTLPGRLHAFDAARAGALLAGVLLHATMSFFLPLPTTDSSPSVALGLLFYLIHPWRMSLFFLIAGYLACGALHRRGVRAFVADRARRIALPLASGWLLLVPATIAIVLWGLGLGAKTAAASDSTPVAGGAPPEGFPLSHLWFLYYLLLLYGATLLGRAAVVGLADRSGRLRSLLDRLFAASLRWGLLPPLLAAPTVALLLSDESWPVWFGIPTPDTGFEPQPIALVAYGSAFLVGWLLARRPENLGAFRRRWAGHLLLAAGFSAASLALVGTTPDLAQPSLFPGPPLARLLYAATYTLAIWCWVFGLLGAALRYANRERPALRYLADASYWIYLVHLPVVFALQVLARDLPLSWAIKYPAIVGITIGLLLLSYDLWVRSTWLGEWLQGRRLPGAIFARRAARPESERVPAESPLPAVPGEGAEPRPPLATLEGVVKRYGQQLALDGLDLAVRPGELLAILGPNGAGKSTAIGLWLGTIEADAGRVVLFGGAPSEVESRLALGVMMQEVALAPTLSTREHVELAAAAYRAPLSVAETLALTGTTELAGRRYGALSAGQKRQVQLATAVCGRPRLLFLDEPSVGLDVAAREAMWRTIRRLRDEGAAIVLTTHYLEEAEALADRVAVLARGRLIAEGSVAEMRALVARRQIRCRTSLAPEEVRSWPGVVEAERDADRLSVIATDAETVVRRLLAADAGLAQLEVRQASLAEAFSELIEEAA